MPSLGSGYTFADFLLRLQRSPGSHMAPLYHTHKELFVHRPDMFSKAVMSVSWEKAVALVQTAYYAQPIAAETYRAVLARMLLHNRHVEQNGIGALVDWRAALGVYSEAVLAHGTALPTRLTTSTLRLLAAHRQWERAIRLLQVADVNDQLTKPMLIEAAHACATPAAWATALDLLTRLHAQDPVLLTESIRALRPPGTDALSVATASHAVLPLDGSATGPDAAVAAHQQQQQRHLVRVLNDVVGAVPGEVLLKNELCFSYVSHLVASTTLPPEAKSQMLATAIQSLQWQQALSLLLTFAEPNLLTDDEWRAAMASSPQLTAVPSSDGGKRKKRKTGKAAKKRPAQEDTGGTEDSMAAVAHESTSGEESPALSSATPVASPVPPVAALVPALRDRLQWLQCAPGTVAALLAALVSKLPAESAAEFVREYLRADSLGPSSSASSSSSQGEHVDGSGPHSLAGTRTDAVSLPLRVSAGRHPVVVQALLRACAGTPDGWQAALPLLLEQSGTHLPTPTDVLSELVLSMRAARQPALVVKLMNDHIVPSGSTLTPEAVEALLECVLAHNRACHQQMLETADAAVTELASSGTSPTNVDVDPRHWQSLQALQGQAVHWLSALSWATQLQADVSEGRITRTGTGPSGGAETRTPMARVAERKTLSPIMLNLLLGICVDAGQPLAALRTLGAARDANKLELQLSEQIRAVLYCALYERPFEAEAIVAHAEAASGEQAAKPLRQLLRLTQLSKEREAALREVQMRTEGHSQI